MSNTGLYDASDGCHTKKQFRIIHFNDVYEIENRDEMHPGAAAFALELKVIGK